MSKVASTVSVVTTDGPAGKGGITISAMCSVTAEPPTLLICVHRESLSCGLIKTNQRFCVNVLKDGHDDMSNDFAGRSDFDEIATLSQAPWQPTASGSLRHEDALVAFDCVLTQYMQVGSHDVIYGAIQDVVLGDGSPLLYANRSYHKLEQEEVK